MGCGIACVWVSATLMGRRSTTPTAMKLVGYAARCFRSHRLISQSSKSHCPPPSRRLSPRQLRRHSAHYVALAWLLEVRAVLDNRLIASRCAGHNLQSAIALGGPFLSKTLRALCLGVALVALMVACVGSIL